VLERPRRGRRLRIEEKRAGSEVHDRRSSNAQRIDVSTRETGRYRRADVPLPNDASSGTIERINIVRFGHHNNHRPAAGGVLDVKGLGVNVTRNRPIKAQDAPKTSGGGLCERSIVVKTVTRVVVVMLGNVDQRIRGNDRSQNSHAQTSNKDRDGK
jgi:hypothetical protein